MKVRKLSYALGAEILGFQVTDRPSAETVSELKDMFHQYQVLLFRNQPISFETHIAFSALFGELDDHSHVPEYRLEGHPHLIKVTNEGKERKKVFGQQWHSDRTQAIIQNIPVGRLGTPNDVAQAVDFLLDARSGFITGQTVYVCGGLTVGLSSV
jgi:hypothetical protein